MHPLPMTLIASAMMSWLSLWLGFTTLASLSQKESNKNSHIQEFAHAIHMCMCISGFLALFSFVTTDLKNSAHQVG